MIKNIFAFSCTLLMAFGAVAQTTSIDKIVGKVGNTIVLQSDIETMFAEQQRQHDTISENYKCEILYRALSQQILVAQADRDSVIVSEEEVEQRINERLSYMLRSYGSKEELEKRLGKTIYQIKDENRKFFKDQMIAERMQGNITANVKITPFEVEQFFNGINKDSLQPYPAKVEIGQIVIMPKPSKELDDYAKERLTEIRKDIVEKGRNFVTMAGIFSMDVASKNNGGEIDINKKDFDPAFVAASFKLQPGEVSPVIKSKFGYHIIQMVNRVNNDEAKVRHILIMPEITSYDLQDAKKVLDSIYPLLVSGKMSFREGVSKFSTDEQAKMTGGMVMNMNTNSYELYIEELDPELAYSISELKVGEFAPPTLYTDMNSSQKAARIVYLKGRTEPHLLNLKDDYAQIQRAALEKKKGEQLEKYIDTKIGEYYIYIDNQYQYCESLKVWFEKMVKNN